MQTPVRCFSTTLVCHLLGLLAFCLFVKHCYLFVFGRAGSPLLLGLFPNCGRRGPLLSRRCSGFSSQWLLLWSTGSGALGFSSCCCQALGLRLSNYVTQAWLLLGMWDLPGPGVKSMSARGKAIDKWFTIVGRLWGLQAGGWEGATSWKLSGLGLSSKEKWGGGKTASFLILE